MAAGDSIVSICNIGLIAIGEDPIAALTDPYKRAILCAARYDQIRREVLRARDWNFARKREVLAASASPVPFGWNAAYVLPSDFIRLRDLDEEDDDDRNWCVEMNGGQLCVLVDETDPGGGLNLKYIFDQQDPTTFDPLFVKALGGAIGAELAIPLSRSTAEKAQAQTLYQNALDVAATASSQENSPREWDVDVMLRARL